MAFGNEVISCSGTTTAIITGNRNGLTALVRNLDTTSTVYLGASDVTADATASTGGLPLKPDETVTISGLHGADTLYGRTTGVAVQVAILYFNG